MDTVANGRKILWCRAAIGDRLALRTGDRVCIDLKRATADILTSEDELAQRKAEFVAQGGYLAPITIPHGRRYSTA